MIHFYNSITKKKELFEPLEKNKVTIYSCGPTVYNYVHIGNLRAYTFSDILIKTLKYYNYSVENVMNLTDVDDKTIKGAQKEFKDEKEEPNEILKKFTKKYSDYFFEDLKAIHIEKPFIIASATASIKEMEFLIQRLFEKGFAYISEDGIYFDLSRYKTYGKLSNIDFNNQKYNKENRVVSDEYEKDNVQDFALWKFKKEENEPSWKIEIDKKEYVGRPGWHIECSAMSMKYLGKEFDIHTGGVDLKFPHHENEIAQSSCALGVENQAKYWMHNEHVLVDGKKMSKSLGNFYTLRDLEEKGFEPLALREVYLRSHYRQQLNFNLESLQAGVVNVKKINDSYAKFISLKPNTQKESDIEKTAKEKLDMFEMALKDDLNTPIALASLYEFLNHANSKKTYSKKDIDIIINFIERCDKVFSLLKKEKQNIPQEIIELAEKRKEARNNNNYGLSDKLRNEIIAKGYEIKDSKDSKSGYIITRRN